MITEILHQILASIPVCFNGLNIGIGYGWTPPILSKIRLSAEYTLENLSWIGSVHQLGRVIGAFLAAFFLNKLGRKKSLTSSAAFLLLSWLGITSIKTAKRICLSRLLFGIGNGISDLTSSVYLGENYPPQVRGIFCSFFVTCFCGAQLIQFVVASTLTYERTALLNCSIAFIGVLLTFWLVETPQFLIIKKKIDSAEKHFMWLRATNATPESSAEFDKLKQTVEEERLKKIFCKDDCGNLIVIFMLNAFTMSTGYAAVLPYITRVFRSSGTTTVDQYTILFGIVQLISCALLSFYIERFNRRTLVLVAYLSITISHVASAVLIYIQENMYPVPNFSWWIFTSVTSYGSIYLMLFTVVRMISGELFPRGKVVSGFAAITMHSIMAFITAKTFLPVAVSYGIYVNFLLYAVVSLVAFVFSYLWLPETKSNI